MTNFEHIPAGEDDLINQTVAATMAQLQRRYSGTTPRRGVHPKDHGCVHATFQVLPNLDPRFRVGLFAVPGQSFECQIRFSNADVNPAKPDSAVGADGSVANGSRGMAVKVRAVPGTPLLPQVGPTVQDFLMINQPVFAFANVVDYLALSKVLVAFNDDPRPFFARPELKTDSAAAQRAGQTGVIVTRIASNSMGPPVPAYQPPPAAPTDNRYFSAAPFLFGPDHVAKWSAAPVPMPGPHPFDAHDPNYLRAGLRQRLAGGHPLVFNFQAQVRDAASLAGKIDTDIENACVEWPEAAYPFQTLATITIPAPQDIDDPSRLVECEALTYSPWNGISAHQPLGGINRMRKAVYIASAHNRAGDLSKLSGFSMTGANFTMGS